jgi:MscS family membrane protein
VRGFLAAGRRGDYALARHFLDTRVSETAAEELASQLYVVLDARLPARLTQVSDEPEGSRANPLAPDEEVVGTIAFAEAPIDIVLERASRPSTGPIWLFSSRTLAAIPAVHADVMNERATPFVPRVLTDRRVAGVRLFDWLAMLLALPAFYFAVVVLNGAVLRLVRAIRHGRLGEFELSLQRHLSMPARLLLVALAIRSLFSVLPLSLLVREFLLNVMGLIVIGATVWLLLRLNGEVERHLCRRLPQANYGAAVSLLRAGRRLVDTLVLLAGLLATLRHFGIDPTPVLAGLGVGGIAVALAAQKTLENVIAGVSLVFDQAVRVGDFLKVGDLQGTVDHIGLRSTRIRTLDRTVVTVPNGQLANMNLEILSLRDKFWFHPVVALRYETTPEQLRAAIDGIRRLLARHPAIDQESVRVRFLRLGTYSLDVEVFAYVSARDWVHFLEIQEQLLFSVTEIVSAAGTAIAFPSQTMYVSAGGSAPMSARLHA